MSEFDANKYFADRFGGLNSTKAQSINAAMREKLAGLREYQAAAQAGRALRNPDRSIGDVLGDAAVTGINGAINLPAAFVGLADIPTGGAVGQFLEEEAGYRPGDAKEITGNWLSDAQKEADLRVQLADGFTETLDAAIQNPSVLAKSVGESVPQILGGAAVARGILGVGAKVVGGAAGGVGPALPGVLAKAVGTNAAPIVAGAVGEGLMGAGSAASQIRDETADGRLTLKQSLAAAGSGLGTAALGLVGGKLAQMAKLPDVDTMLASGALTKSPSGFVKAVLGAGISEGAFEEMPQSVQEQMWQNYALDKPLLEEVGDSAALGLLSGMAMGHGAGGVSAAAGISLKRSEERATKEANQAAAIATGDVSDLADPKKDSFAPEMAIAALVGNSQLETTSQEAKLANLSKGREIIFDLEARREVIASRLVPVDQKKAELAQVQAQIATTPATDARRLQALNLQAEILAEEIAAPAPDAKTAAKMKTELTKIDRQLGEARKSLQDLDMASQTPEFVASQVELANATVTQENAPQAQEAVTRILAMASLTPERLDTDTALALANNTANSLTDAQRGFLRAFSEARIAANQLRDVDAVKSEILDGSPDNMGIATYRERVMKALAFDDKRGAVRSMAGLDKFALDHQSKATLAAKAKAMFDADKQPRHVARTEAGWEIRSGHLDDKARAESGSLNIGANSTKVVAKMGLEAKALTAAAAELKAAYDIKFTPQPAAAKEAANVTNAPQQGSGTQVASAAAVPQAAAATGGQSAQPSQPAAGPAPATGGTADVVEAPGVTATQAEYDEAVRVKNSTDESDYDNVPENIGRLVTALNNEEEIKITQSTEGDPVSSVDSQETQSTENTQSTESSQSSGENQSTEEDTTVEEQPQTIESGELSAFQNKSPEGTEYLKRNLVADFFSQSKGKDGDSTQRPLVAVKDFMTSVTKDGSILGKFVSGWTNAGEQLTVVRRFQKVAMHWGQLIDAQIKVKQREDFRYEDMSQFLLNVQDGKGVFDENVKTAISYAAFAYVAEQSGRSQFNSDEEINRILDRDEDTRVSQRERNALGKVGTRQNVVINNLGKKAVQALGLRLAPNAPVDLMPRLESALGAHALNVLLTDGLLERKTIDAEVMKSLTKSNDTDANAKHQFIAFARNEQGDLSAKAQQITQAVRGSKGVLDRLFGVEAGLKEPSHKPIPFVQKKTKGTRQNVPVTLARVMKHENSVASYVRQDMVRLMGAIDDDAMMEIAGAEHVEGKHAANIPNTEAKNDGLRREIERFKEFVGGMFKDGKPDLTLPLYFEHSVWKQQRVGIATNMINPQTSKVHRHMLYRSSWETTIRLDNQAKMDNFLLRVGEGFGIKTDKQGNVKSLAAAQTKLADPKIQKAVGVLVSLLQDESIGSLTETQQADLVAGVKAGGEAMHSLDALVAVAHMEVAKAAGQPSFKTHLMGEVDGVTNGPMLSHLLMGAAATAKDLFGLLNRGGFFEQGNEHSQYNLWREAAGHLDLYETTALHMTQLLQNMPGPLESIYAFTGELADKDGKVGKAGRNIVKTPLTAMVFGSSVRRAADSMAEKFVEAVYAKIEDLAAGKDGLTRESVIDHLNTLLEQGGAQQLDTDLSVDALMGTELTYDQVDALKAVFSGTVGEAIKEVMQADFGLFMEQRSQLNQVAQLTFSIYYAAYQAMREKFLQEQMDAYAKDPSTGVAFKETKSGKRVALHDLSAQQEAELRKQLRKLTPIAHTAMSKASGSLASGLYIAKSDVKLSKKKTFEGEVSFSKGTMKSVETRGYEQTEADPGVAMIPMLTHATDSFVMHESIGTSEVLNVHDAKGVGVGGFKQAAESLNASTWKAMLDYSPASELTNALFRTVRGAAELIRSNQLPEEAGKAMKAAIAKLAQRTDLKDVSPADVLTILGHNAVNVAFRANDVKLGAMSQMQAIDQYAFEGGNYKVTDEDRAAAQALRAGLRSEILPEDAADLEVVAAFLNGESVAVQEEPTAEEQPDPSMGAQEKVDISNALAAQLLDQVTIDRSLPEAFRDQVQLVLDEMVSGAKGLAAAAHKVLTRSDAVAVIQSVLARRDKANTSFWGEVGPSKAGSDPALVEFLENTPKPEASDLMQVLAKQIQARPSSIQRDLYMHLLKQLYTTVDKDLPILYVTQHTPAEYLSGEKAPSRARGFYLSRGEGLFLMAPEFKNSGLTVELVMHELVHAALYDAVHKPTPGSQELIAELETLRSKAIQYAEAQGTLQRYLPALQNVDEMIAYGLTNREFQHQVLSKITMRSKTRRNDFVNGMKAFIETVTSILFRGSEKSSQAKTVNGMTVLVTNVSGLFFTAQESNILADRMAGPSEILAMTSLAQDYSTLDIHRALDNGKVSSAFQDHLAELLGGIVEKLHGPFGSFKAALMQNQTGSPMGVWLKAMYTGKAPFASQIQGTGLVDSEQELFVLEQVEATMVAALETNETQTKMVYRELAKLFAEAQARIKPQDFHDGDWATATIDEQKAAKAKWDFLFNVRSGANGRSDYLARFAAVGLASEKVNKLLQFDTDMGLTASPKTVGERVQAVFEKVLQFIQEKWTHTFKGQRADLKLEMLVEQLVDIEAKRRHALTQQNKLSGLTFPLEEGIKDAFATARKKVSQAAGSQLVRDNGKAFVRAAGGLARTIADDKVDKFLDAMAYLRDLEFKDRPGVLAGLIKDVRGFGDRLVALTRAKTNHDRKRKAIMNSASKTVLGMFANEGKDLGAKTKDAISAVFMRTGAHTLLGTMTLAEIGNVLRDKTALQQAIDAAEARLGSIKFKHYFIAQANVLGYYKATGQVRDRHMMMNAHNIVKMFGTPYEGQLSQAPTDELIPVVEQLVTLYALGYSKDAHVRRAADVLASESQRTDGQNGVEAVLKLQRKLEQESLERLFGGNRTLMMHGYTPEVYNPNIAVVAATEAEGKELINRGYVKREVVGADPADPDREIKHLYTMRDGGLQPFLAGAINIGSMAAKGSNKHNGHLNVNTWAGTQNAAMQAAITNDPDRRAALARMFQAKPRQDLSKMSGTFLAPVVNDRGQLVNWRYLMNEDSKDQVLERTNGFDKLMGVLAGSIYDKQTAPEQNRTVIQTLKDVHQEQAATQPAAFIEVGPNSPDPEMREIWAMLPEQAKAEVKAIWKTNYMKVRKDSLDLVFGYRKLSLANAFDKKAMTPADLFRKDPNTRNVIEQITVSVVTELLVLIAKVKHGKSQAEAEEWAKRGAMVVAKGERMWQELVREAKDILVVKTGVVMLGNIWSNLWLLGLSGVSMKEIGHHHLVAMKGATAYLNDSEELARLRLLLESGYTGVEADKARSQIAVLEDSLARNPAAELIEAGLMPSIVEDVALDDDPYSYKSALVRKVDTVAQKMNPTVVTAARTMYMAHDTALYKGLSRITQLSDFVARYTLYQHLISRKADPMDKASAIHEAGEAFVNYDIPMHRAVQYMDDMGITMFTKYFLRIQRVLQKLAKDNPARVLGTLLLGNFLDLGPIVLEGSAVFKIGNNPLNMGPLELFDAFDELATLQPAMTLIK